MTFVHPFAYLLLALAALPILLYILPMLAKLTAPCPSQPIAKDYSPSSCATTTNCTVRAPAPSG